MEIKEIWDTIISKLVECTESALKLVADRELDSDPNRGVTEIGLKLILLTVLANVPDFNGIKCESEKLTSRFSIGDGIEIQKDSFLGESGRFPSGIMERET